MKNKENNELEIINLGHTNPTVSQIRKMISKHEKIWVGFNKKRYFVLDTSLLDRFVENLSLDEDDLIEEIF